MKTKLATPTEPLTATEVRQMREDHLRAVANAMQAKMDNDILDLLLPRFGEGIYDYDD